MLDLITLWAFARPVVHIGFGDELEGPSQPPFYYSGDGFGYGCINYNGDSGDGHGEGEMIGELAGVDIYVPAGDCYGDGYDHGGHEGDGQGEGTFAYA
jgi:hypothetical protein